MRTVAVIDVAFFNCCILSIQLSKRFHAENNRSLPLSEYSYNFAIWRIAFKINCIYVSNEAFKRSERKFTKASNAIFHKK